MNDSIEHRVHRIYAAIGAIEEANPAILRAKVVDTPEYKEIIQDFRGELSGGDLYNQAYSAVHNIANLRDHLRRWAVKNNHDKTRVDLTTEGCFELQVICDLSNNDKHGYPSRDTGHSKRSPKLINIDRVMRLQTLATAGSWVTMTLGMDGVPSISGDGSAKAVVTGEVVDEADCRIGDLYEILVKATAAWERLLCEFNIITLT